jgi:hypothetical protein
LICMSAGMLTGQTTQESTKPKQDETKAATSDSKQETEQADEKAPDPITVSVAADNIQFTASGTWKSVKPRSRMLEAELKILRVGDDTEDGRLTIMGAGGTIDANIVRWQRQFTQSDGSDTKEKTKLEKQQISGQTVNLVDISGTFMDSPGGPFSGQPKVERENYRMLAAIIETADTGNYFVKFYGPKATVDKNAEHFKAMIKSLKIVE